MKKQKKTEKKLSLKKLQLAKITKSLNSIKGGSAAYVGDDNQTIVEQTLGGNNG
ncbi:MULTISPECIES: hypothetical protein [Chryseobacterium]|uniref:Bacteriocin-like protein n=1 Tax=Chryseobacterium geocarposphaerae TaxID=1416776 RepID=A0ABU1L965_9FLAO|nr:MULTISPECIES: hypothetical protein [Chryseobacterium]MDR6403259.1 hypothetical protein [Chryseobacterium geocarposphaerae]MDR6696813.1 hypothetical protein [Chryseobacterium ginsenosidimutans]